MAELNGMFGGSGGSKVKSRQMIIGSVTSSWNTNSNKTHTLSAVDTSKTYISTILAGSMNDRRDSDYARASIVSVTLTNSTTLTVDVGTSDSGTAVSAIAYYQFEVIEYE